MNAKEPVMLPAQDKPVTTNILPVPAPQAMNGKTKEDKAVKQDILK